MNARHRILIVDDDADDRDILSDAFGASDEGHECVQLDNGDRLLDYLVQQHGGPLPSLIMLDLNMPGRDGRETLKALKGDGRFQSIPIVVFTTSSSHRDKQSVYGLGANCFISKPDTYNKLVELTAAIGKLWLQ